MGESHEHTCKDCGYAATVSGGAEHGFLYVSVTIFCRDCDFLYDVNPDQDAETFAAGGGDVRSLTGLRCPVDAGHKWEFWKAGDPCPRCQGAMEITGVGCCWD